MFRNFKPLRFFVYLSLLFVGLHASISHAQSFFNNTVGDINDSTLCPGATGSGTTANLTRTFNVSGLAPTVTDINVGFLATHSWRGDIRLTLSSPGPSPVSVTLLTTDTSGNGNDDNYNIELGDEAAVVANSGTADGPHDVSLAPYQILARPNNVLSAFNGVNPNGTWTLEMCDDYAGENGEYLQSTLFFSSPTDADLNLSVAIDNNFPQYTDTITLTYNLVNSGPSAASSVTVNAPLPSGLSFISASGSGAYNNASGLWSFPTTLSAGSTSTLTVTATVLPSGNNSVVAEVQTSSQNDPDSTPGNNAPTEDDYATLIYLPQPPLTPPALSCAASEQFAHAWGAPGSVSGWASGSTTNNYSVGTTPLNFANHWRHG